MIKFVRCERTARSLYVFGVDGGLGLRPQAPFSLLSLLLAMALSRATGGRLSVGDAHAAQRVVALLLLASSGQLARLDELLVEACILSCGIVSLLVCKRALARLIVCSPVLSSLSMSGAVVAKCM